MCLGFLVFHSCRYYFHVDFAAILQSQVRMYYIHKPVAGIYEIISD